MKKKSLAWSILIFGAMLFCSTCIALVIELLSWFQSDSSWRDILSGAIFIIGIALVYGFCLGVERVFNWAIDNR